MARQVLTDEAIEESTYIVTVAFTDEDDDAVIPNAPLVWTLTDMAGNVINSREDVSITPASSIDIVLSGDDLEVFDDGGLDNRLVTVQGTYNSDAGNNLPLKDEVVFPIRRLVVVT